MRVQHTFNSKSGLPKDGIVNTFHFLGAGDVDATAAGAMATIVKNFYDQSNTGGIGLTRLSEQLGGKALAETAHTIKVYDMADAKPRVPVVVFNTSLSVPNTNEPLPAEVALCLSYRRIPVSGSKPARERGRIYIGPLAVSTQGAAGPDGHVRPTDAVRNTLIFAGRRMAAEALAAGWEWHVYSPTSDALGDDTPSVAINEVICDDAFDTIRARGCARLGVFALGVPAP